MSTKNINKILIANRNEIALRIMKSAQAMGIQCVAIYSNSDSNSLHVRQADEAYSLKADIASESYLDINKIISIAKESGCDAIHPGYGFLAENANFAKACKNAGIIFIGPKADAIELMGDKARSKAFAKEKQIPVIPGEEQLEQSLENFKTIAKTIGVPLLIKASAGGGGKGMKLVRDLSEVETAFNSAKREAKAAFGDDTLLIEKYFDSARHVEVQVLADQHGNVVHLFDRDCSLQRRHQKVIEEAPAYGISETTKNAMYDCAVKLCKLINYEGAGTLEFLMDEKENFYLMEMNTRLQVEHAVSEQITGIDLVKEQILIASGKALSFKQDDIKQHGHSIEARIYAEQCRNNFLPASGTISLFGLPKTGNGIRIDHALQDNQEITSLYDPMIAKIACWGETRELAIANLSKTIQGTQILGVETNREFVHACIEHPSFGKNDVSTRFIDKHLEQLNSNSFDINKLGSITFTLFEKAKQHLLWHTQQKRKISPWHQSDDFRVNDKTDKSYTLNCINLGDTALHQHKNHVFESKMEFRVRKIEENKLLANWALKEENLFGIVELAYLKNLKLIADLKISSTFGDFFFHLSNPATNKKINKHSGESRYYAPLNGRVIAVNFSEGSTVEAGQEVIVIEAMKMEHPIKARNAGSIKQLNVEVNQQISADQFVFEVISDSNKKNG